MEKLPPGKRAVAINFEAVGRAYEAAASVLQNAGERPAAMLVLAARIIKLHARMAGTPVDVTLANVRGLLEQFESGPTAPGGDC